jgi:NAD(P)-dependent dehydrogenase (short-subunit alcohol dehydrogenase family)
MLYTGSGGAYLGLTDKTAYTMGKAALGALARTVANKWGSKGVRANVIAPGLILHPAVIDAMGQRFVDQSIKAIPLARIGDPRDIAGMAALLLSDDGSYVTGQSISVDGGRTMRA